MIPYDPQILCSFINTELRDNYKNLDDCCKGLGVKKEDIVKKLKSIEYIYDEKSNRFI